MAPIEAGQPAPEFSLATYEGDRFTRDDLLGRITVLVFYPFAFSPVCTDQLGLYNEVLDDFTARGVTLTVERGTERRKVTVRMVPERQFFNTELIRKRLGLSLQELTPELADDIVETIFSGWK